MREAHVIQVTSAGDRWYIRQTAPGL